MSPPWLAGLDGCRAGWVAAFVRPTGDEAHVRIVPRFADVLAAPEAPAIVAVDMPIGLPDRIGPDGRGPERAIRPLLGARRSSVFSVPSRAAVYAEPGRFNDLQARYAAHQRACKVALATSDPPKRIAIQCFAIFAKIREVDCVLRERPAYVERVFETHPELAFCRLNGGRTLGEPKKTNAGLSLRRDILLSEGLPEAIVTGAPPQGAGADDLLDALACAMIARRRYHNKTEPFPRSFGHDSFGLPVAIWA